MRKAEILDMINKEREEWIKIHNKYPNLMTAGALKALDEFKQRLIRHM